MYFNFFVKCNNFNIFSVQLSKCTVLKLFGVNVFFQKLETQTIVMDILNLLLINFQNIYVPVDANDISIDTLEIYG